MVFFPREQAREILENELEQLINSEYKQKNNKNLIIGLAANYNKSKIVNFVVSLRRSGFRDDVVLLMTSIDRETRSFLNDYNITPVVCWHSLFSYFHMSSSRHISYYNYLSNISAETVYDRIFLTDIGDVFFQDDPFSVIPDDNITFFLEDSSVLIGDCPINSHWVCTTFSKDKLQEIAHYPISCAGTVIGKSRVILEYILQMLISLTSLPESSLTALGLDQAVHNVLIRKQMISGQRIAENGDGVLTLHHVFGSAPIIYAQDEFTAIHGREPVFIDSKAKVYYLLKDIAVIHQYNRIAQFSNIVTKHYAS